MLSIRLNMVQENFNESISKFEIKKNPLNMTLLTKEEGWYGVLVRFSNVNIASVDGILYVFMQKWNKLIWKMQFHATMSTHSVIW